MFRNKEKDYRDTVRYVGPSKDREAEQLLAVRGTTVPNPVSAEFMNSSQPITARPQEQEKDKTILTKILGGENPYPKLETPRIVTDTNAKVKEESGMSSGTETGTGSLSTVELLNGLLDPNFGTRASEDVMGQYAAMTGGRPSSAAISAGTAAKADAEAALLRELLSAESGGGDDKNGGGHLSGLISGGGEGTAGNAGNVPEEYADYADLPAYGTIVPVLEKMENNTDMAEYLADMVNRDVITEDAAKQYLKRFEDVYEITGLGGVADYASMVQNVGGWTAVTDGGGNRSGTIDRNARVKAPTGDVLTLAQLYRILKKHGMEKDDARRYIIKLQDHLGI